MLIDWFTVGAQVLNFLILVWLMKHFLYQPILNAIDGREKKIAAELAEAAAQKAEAAQERESFQKKNTDFDEERSGLLSTATDEANAERQRLLEAARQRADELAAKRQRALHREAQNLSQALARRTQREVFSIARKTLGDLADAELEERIVALFTRRLREMENGPKEALGVALKSASAPIVVRSAFELPEGARSTVQTVINETFSVNAPLHFETKPDLVSGIELTASGQKIAWSIADYLTSLERGVGELLKEKDKPQPKAAKPASPAHS